MSENWNVYESFQALLELGPYHLALEGLLVAWVVWLLLAAKSRPRPIKLTKKEEEQLIAEWEPEPLLSTPPDQNHPALHPRTVKGKLGHYCDLGTGPLLNLASNDFLRLSERSGIEKAALDCLHQYGVGSCGPRGFYGTTEMHMDLEQRIADFFGQESAVLYSYGFSTIASVIPAYSKSGDVIFVDEAVSFPIQRGLQASRSRLVFFRHNDTEHLRQLLEQQNALDLKNQKKALATRRFLMVEGLYYNTGNICPLPELVALRQQYKLRLFVDESCSLGVLGDTGRGVTDHFNVPMHELDLIICSLELAVASTGGFACGTKYVVDHQRLSGIGYVFSASLPPMLAAAAKESLSVIDRESASLIPALQSRCREVHAKLLKLLPVGVSLGGDALSAIKHLSLAAAGDGSSSALLLTDAQQEALLRRVVNEAECRGCAIIVASLNRASEGRITGTKPPPPSIRLVVNCNLTSEEITTTVQVVVDSFAAVLNSAGATA